MSLIGELGALTRSLDEHQTAYALVGGLAVSVWGIDRVTTDIDLLVEKADIDRAAAIAKRCGFTMEDFPRELEDGMEMRRLSKIESQGTFLTLNLLLVGSAQRHVWETRQRIPFQEGTVVLASREGLIQMKLAAGRPQDLADVDRLKDLNR
jgi:hypothetical protein